MVIYTRLPFGLELPVPVPRFLLVLVLGSLALAILWPYLAYLLGLLALVQPPLWLLLVLAAVVLLLDHYLAYRRWLRVHRARFLRARWRRARVRTRHVFVFDLPPRPNRRPVVYRSLAKNPYDPRWAAGEVKGPGRPRPLRAGV